jgi:hypothetical protein
LLLLIFVVLAGLCLYSGEHGIIRDTKCTLEALEVGNFGAAFGPVVRHCHVHLGSSLLCSWWGYGSELGSLQVRQLDFPHVGLQKWNQFRQQLV